MSKLPLYLSSAFLLVYHGSRDPRPKKVCHQLAGYFQQKLEIAISESQDNYCLKKHTGYHSHQVTLESSPPETPPLVETVALELAPLPLHQNILRFAESAIALGKKNLVIIPLFLSLGVHVQQDIPSEIALAQNQLPESIKLKLNPPLGSYSGLETILCQQFQQLSPSKRILLAHGSRLTTANQQTEYLARQCTAQVAYWSTKPNLEAVVEQMANNTEKIAITPYFLFPGRITDAIADKITQLQQQFPSIEFILGQPLGAKETLAQLIFHNITA
ncbi:MAG: sirohydrochlorin chelatase [Xenococcaceae cyanobacterium MO_167.B27]|nr:sirohydrochlorin chelatase [Xenococcaceae cyanobacterium MO_167.B27]